MYHNQAMDWFSWLSNCNLDPSLVHNYALILSRNELQAEDLTHFNHEFLQSMGISIAKHRLEIIKLAKKEVGAGSTGLSRLKLAMHKTKKSLRKCFSKLVFNHDSMVVKSTPEVVAYRGQWRGPLSRKWKSEKELVKVELPSPVMKTSRQAKSGPLDRRLQENLMLPFPTNRHLKLSGPLDAKMNERLVFAYRSPIQSGTQQRYVLNNNKSPQRPMTLNRTPATASPKFCSDESRNGIEAFADLDERSLCATLFQDLKPT